MSRTDLAQLLLKEWPEKEQILKGNTNKISHDYSRCSSVHVKQLNKACRAYGTTDDTIMSQKNTVSDDCFLRRQRHGRQMKQGWTASKRWREIEKFSLSAWSAMECGTLLRCVDLVKNTTITARTSAPSSRPGPSRPWHGRTSIVIKLSPDFCHDAHGKSCISHLLVRA